MKLSDLYLFKYLIDYYYLSFPCSSDERIKLSFCGNTVLKLKDFRFLYSSLRLYLSVLNYYWLGVLLSSVKSYEPWF